jgi:RNA polymerase sigma-70 factor (ECF subfamily)
MQGAGIEPGASSAMDGDLFARARGGDLAAFEAIAVQRLPELYRLARAILGVDSRAAEATSNTLVGAWHELPHLDDPARFDAWLDRILVSECRMNLERAGHEHVPRTPGVAPDAPGAAPVPWDTPDAPAAPPDAPPDELDRDAIIRMLDGAFESLDGVDRAVLVLHDVGRRSPAAIAGTLHMPVGTVKWRLHEAHLALRAALEVPA